MERLLPYTKVGTILVRCTLYNTWRQPWYTEFVFKWFIFKGFVFIDESGHVGLPMNQV